jgi:hypothetical protein
MASANEKALYMTLSVIGEASNQQVPLDEGTLQSSQFVNVEDGIGLISYGGGPGTGFPKVPYAIRWHENSANFQKGRKKRYLADPFNQLADKTYKKSLKATAGKQF